MTLRPVSIALTALFFTTSVYANWIHDELKSGDGYRIVRVLIYLMSHPEHYDELDEQGRTLAESALKNLNEPALAEYLFQQPSKKAQVLASDNSHTEVKQDPHVPPLPRDVIGEILKRVSRSPTWEEVNRYRLVSKQFKTAAEMAFQGRVDFRVKSVCGFASLMLLAESDLAPCIGKLALQLQDLGDPLGALLANHDLQNVALARQVLTGFDDGSVTTLSLLSRLATVYLPLFLESKSAMLRYLHSIEMRTNVPHLVPFIEPFIAAVFANAEGQRAFPALNTFGVHTRLLEPFVRSQILASLPARQGLQEVDIVGFPLIAKKALSILLSKLPLKRFKLSRDVSLKVILQRLAEGGFKHLEDIDARDNYFNPTTDNVWKDKQIDLSKFKSLKRIAFCCRGDQVAWCNVLLRTPSNARLIELCDFAAFLKIDVDGREQILAQLAIASAILQLPQNAIALNPALLKMRNDLVEIFRVVFSCAATNL